MTFNKDTGHFAEFEIVGEQCYFCSQSRIISFNEHYNFCPNCAAIYTNLIVEQGCKHINDNTNIVVHSPPWFKSLRGKEKPYVIETEINKVLRQHCSICKKSVILDGW